MELRPAAWIAAAQRQRRRVTAIAAPATVKAARWVQVPSAYQRTMLCKATCTAGSRSLHDMLVLGHTCAAAKFRGIWGLEASGTHASVLLKARPPQ